ncbi:MAG: putative murein peptide carboxypeptidase [Eubacteriales bacterium SKADARSKE-1]|nr:putative murein peptide carboxypeptidase [Eubacteriales bacterium SKADARSKE-1]
MNKLSKFLLFCFTMVFMAFGSIKLNVLAFEGELLTPSALKAGDTICILEPSRTTVSRKDILQERIPYVIKKLEERGFKVIVANESFKPTELELGDGTEQIRADAFNNAVRKPEVKAIFAFWGGYGAMHILDKIDYEAFRKNKPIFVGFSDETALLIPIFEKAGVVSFHGPMVGASFNCQETKTFDCLFDMLMNPKDLTELKNIDDDSPFKVYKDGTCEGNIIGGNLCLTQCLMGTPYQIDFKDKILFFEEVEESAYRLHRLLWQLKLSGNLEKLSGIVVGTLTPVKGESEQKLLNAAFDVLKELNIPIIYNIHAGHLKNPLTIPVGAKAKIEGNKLFITQQVVE